MEVGLDEMLKAWGIAKRRILGIWVQQPRSILGRMVEEGAGAGIRGQESSHPEVMTGEPLLVARGIRMAIDDHTLRYEDNQCLFLHYVCYGKASAKARHLRIPLAVYFTRLNRAKSAIAPHIVAMVAVAEGS
jgi:hypothetical protein